MKTITLESGKKVEISEESYNNLAESIKKDFTIDNNSSLVKTYKMVCELKNEQKIQTTKKKEQTNLCK